MHIEFKSKRDEAVSRPINVSWIEPLTACGLLLRIGDAPSCHHAICYKKGGWGLKKTFLQAFTSRFASTQFPLALPHHFFSASTTSPIRNRISQKPLERLRLPHPPIDRHRALFWRMPSCRKWNIFCAAS